MKQKQTNKPRILIVDIENSPNLAYIWQLRNNDYISETMVAMPWYMLCWCAKWLDEKQVISSALIDFPKEYNKDRKNFSVFNPFRPTSEKKILQKLWKLLDEADIIIGHNVDGFDCKKINACFIMNNMTPPSPYKTIDTLKIARKHFMFTSNKLNSLVRYFKMGAKVETGGFKLWEECMKGDKKAWKKMVTYCKNDVILSQKVYEKMLPYISNHPNMGVYEDGVKPTCPKCHSEKLVKEGLAHTNNGTYQQYSCKNCGGWSRGKKNLRENQVKTTNA